MDPNPKEKEKAHIDALLQQSKIASARLSREQINTLLEASGKPQQESSLTGAGERNTDEESPSVVSVQGSEGLVTRTREEKFDEGIGPSGEQVVSRPGDNKGNSSSSTQRVLVPRSYFPPQNFSDDEIDHEDSPEDEATTTTRGRSENPHESSHTEDSRSVGNTPLNAFLVREEANTEEEGSVPLTQPALQPGQPEIVEATPIPKGAAAALADACAEMISNHKWLLCSCLTLFLLMLASIVAAVFLLRRTNGKDNGIPVVPPKQDDNGGIFNKTQTVAKSSRYWDCSGGACGCSHLPFGDPDKPAYCHGNILVRAPEENPHNASFYGTAAISEFLGGDWWLGDGCTKCWKVTGTSNAGPTAGTTTTLVIKGTNFCPPEACGDGPFFMIAAPGFLGIQNIHSLACEQRELIEDLESWSTCLHWSAESPENCNCSVFKDPILTEGCENFLGLGWDDPMVTYEKLDDCPIELRSLPCWETNGNDYPVEIPELCAGPYGHAAK